MTAARSTAVGTPDASRISPTSSRERRCAESSSSSGRQPAEVDQPAAPPAARAASPKRRAFSRSVRSKPRVPSAWIR